jgi:hypothetical protein
MFVSVLDSYVGIRKVLFLIILDESSHVIAIVKISYEPRVATEEVKD